MLNCQSSLSKFIVYNFFFSWPTLFKTCTVPGIVDCEYIRPLLCGYYHGQYKMWTFNIIWLQIQWNKYLPMAAKSSRLSWIRKLQEAFSRHVGSKDTLSLSQLRKALNEIDLYPTKSQVYEIVHCACECSGRTPVDHLTFGEFCFLVAELQEQYRRSPVPPVPRSQLKEKFLIALEERRWKRRLSGKDANFRVFLGGSCNPTTWRHDVAIPFLKHHDITFYNPQVSDWKPELIEIEDQAKQTAELLFFVIDNQTRSTASMVEAAYLAGCGRQLILVIRSFVSPTVIYGETLSAVELEDLERSHAYLTDLVERQGIPVFNNIDAALKCTDKAIHQNQRVTELGLEDGAQPVKFPHIRVADKFMKVHDAFKNYDNNHSGRLSARDVMLAYRTVTYEELHPSALSGTRDKMYNFEEFCCLLAEYRYKRKSLVERVMTNMMRFPTKFVDWFRGHSHTDIARLPEASQRRRDIFLGGTCGKSTWRTDIAIPLLRKHGISYYNPQLVDWNTWYIPLEAAAKDSCKLLLYVVAADTRGVTSMLEVGHFIGQGCNIVLCLQALEEGAEIEGEELTINAVKDYNRARTYLADLANRDGVPVFEDVLEAVHCAINRLDDSS